MALTESGRVFTWGSSDDGGIGRPGGDDAPEQLPGQVGMEMPSKECCFCDDAALRCVAL